MSTQFNQDTSLSSQTTVDLLHAQLKDAGDELLVCIQNCIDCSQSCESLIQHCLRMGGVHSDPSHIRLLQDCASVCTLAAQFMLRESEFDGRLCALCSLICLRCAEDCERMPDDEVMQQCAEICHRCANSCQEMEIAH